MRGLFLIFDRPGTGIYRPRAGPAILGRFVLFLPGRQAMAVVLENKGSLILPAVAETKER